MSKKARQVQRNYGQKSNRRIRKQMQKAAANNANDAKQISAPMQNWRRILMVLAGLAIACFLASCFLHGQLQVAVLITGAFVIACMLAIWGIKWKCPHCGSHLGRNVSNTYRCKNCGKII